MMGLTGSAYIHNLGLQGYWLINSYIIKDDPRVAVTQFPYLAPRGLHIVLSDTPESEIAIIIFGVL